MYYLLEFMKLIKLLSIFLIFIIVSGCMQTTALLGPGVTVVTTGNVFQAGLQYGANTAIKNQTGKDTLEHLKDAVHKKNNERNFRIKFTEIIENRVQNTRQKLSLN